MQLRLFRYSIIIPVLVSVVCFVAGEESIGIEKTDLSATVNLGYEMLTDSKNKNPLEDTYQNDNFFHEKNSNDGVRIKRSSLGDRRERTTFVKAIVSNPKLSSTQILAHRLAKEALGSQKMRDTFKKLTEIKSKEDDSIFSENLPVKVAMHSGLSKASERVHKPYRGVKRRRKIHKKRRRQRINENFDRTKRASAKKEIHKTREENSLRHEPEKLMKVIVSRNENQKELPVLNYHRVKDNEEKGFLFPNVARKAVREVSKLPNENYICDVDEESSNLMYPVNSASAQLWKNEERARQLFERESMIARLMKTTTKDPLKNNTGDQGVEYSEYYNDGDILVDPSENKVQSKLNEIEKNTQVRSPRQAVNVSSFYNPQGQVYIRAYPQENIIQPFGTIEGYNAMVQNIVPSQNVPDLNAGNALNHVGKYIPINRNINPGNMYYLPNSLQRNVTSRSVLRQVPIYFNSPDPNSSLENKMAIAVEPNIHSLRMNLKNDKSRLPLFSNINNNQQYGTPYLVPQQQRIKLYSPQEQYNALTSSHEQIEFNDPEHLSPHVKNELELSLMAQRSTDNVQKLMSSFTKSNEKPCTSSLNFMVNIQPSLDKIVTHLANNVNQNQNSIEGAFSVQTAENNKMILQASEAPSSSITVISSSSSIASTVDHLTVNIAKEMEKPLTNNDTRTAVQQSQQQLGTNNVNTTTMANDFNSKEKGIGNTIPVFDDSENDKKKEDLKTKRVKVTEYHLLPMTTLSQPQVAATPTVPVNLTAIVNETKEVAEEILDKIIDELDNLKVDHSKNDQKEGLPCRLTGSWVTIQAGVRIDMTVLNHTIIANLAKLTPLPVHQGLLDTTWNITGYAPFKRGGPFTLIATDNHTKSLAAFVGACKVCQGIDTIEGLWTVSREPRDCRDFHITTNIFNEIFQRTRLLSAIKEKQQEMGSTLATPKNNRPTGEKENLSFKEESRKLSIV